MSQSLAATGLRRKELELRKVLGTDNPADLFTKHLESAKRLEHLIDMFSCSFVEGRARTAPSLKKSATSPQEIAASLELHVLPHLLPRDQMDAEFFKFEAPSGTLDEDDVTPEAELADPVPKLLAGSGAQFGHAANSGSTTVPCTATTKQSTFRVPRQVRATAHMVCEREASELGSEVDATVSGISRSNPSCRASSCGPTPRAVRVTNPHASGLRSVGRCLGNDAAQHKRNTTEREAKHRDRGLRQR